MNAMVEFDGTWSCGRLGVDRSGGGGTFWSISVLLVFLRDLIGLEPEAESAAFQVI